MKAQKEEGKQSQNCQDYQDWHHLGVTPRRQILYPPVGNLICSRLCAVEAAASVRKCQKFTNHYHHHYHHCTS